MTAGGKMPETHWDDARVALRVVAEFFANHDDFSLEELRGLENYGLIPEPVRAALEDLNRNERQILKGFFITLEENHFYLEIPRCPFPPFY
jgi:hypothetical protein